MISSNKIFGNLFNTPLITPDRLLLGAKDHLVRITKGNTTHQFDAEIAILTPLIEVLEADVSNVDTTQNLQSGQTDEVDILTYNFHRTLSTLDGVIANSLGGKGTTAYKEFYPHGMTEYDQANRTTMVMLTTRVNKAATKYATQLGIVVTPKLQAFQAAYVTARGSQSTSIADLSSGKTDKKDSVIDVEVGLTQSLHKVGNLFPADVVKCSGFFNFNLFFTVGHRKHVLYNETLAVAGQVVVVNRSFTDNVTIIIRNTGTNADIIVWIGATSTDAPNAQAVTIKPGKSMSVLPSSLGDADSTFLWILNASDVNTANGQIETIG